MGIIEIINETALEIIAIATVGITMGVIGYQAVTGGDITMQTEPAMMVLGFFFGKKL